MGYGPGDDGRINAAGTQGAFGGWNVLRWFEVVFNERKPGRPGNLFRDNAVDSGLRRGFPPKVNSPRHEFGPTMNGPWLLFTRYNGSTDTFRVLLWNGRTKVLKQLAAASGVGEVYSGQVLGDFATWYFRGPVRSDVYRYRISTQRTETIPRPAGFARQYDPSVASDGTVFFHRRVSNACGSSAVLVKYPLGGPAQVVGAHPAGRDGGRTYVDDSRYYGEEPYRYIAFTSRICSAPQHRALDRGNYYESFGPGGWSSH